MQQSTAVTVFIPVHNAKHLKKLGSNLDPVVRVDPVAVLGPLDCRPHVAVDGAGNSDLEKAEKIFMRRPLVCSKKSN